MCVCVCVCVCSIACCVQLFAVSWTVAHQTLLSMEFSRQEYWNGSPFPPLEDIPDPSMEGIYPFFFGFPSPLGHHRALSRIP